MKIIVLLNLFIVLPLTLCGQAASNSVGGAVNSVRHSLETSLEVLADTRKLIAEEKVPLAKQLNELNAEVLDLRKQDEKANRLNDTQSLDR